MPDYTSFPVNEMGEPLMDGAAWRFEQALDAESDYYDDADGFEGDPDDDPRDSPTYCDRCDSDPCICHEIVWDQPAADPV